MCRPLRGLDRLPRLIPGLARGYLLPRLRRWRLLAAASALPSLPFTFTPVSAYLIFSRQMLRP